MCFLLMLGLLGVTAAASAQNTVRFKLAAHNVENFFDVYDDPYTLDEAMRIKSRKAIDELGAVWKKMDADFIGVEELENEGILARFRGWHFAGAGYDYLWCNQLRGTRGINVGFMSRIPTDEIRVRKFQRLTLPGDEGKWMFARDLVSVDLKPASDVSIEVFILHLKSKRDSEGDAKSARWRLAEATRLRQIVDQRLAANPQAMIAIIGDFNDTPESDTIKTLLAPSGAGAAKPALIDAHAGLPVETITYLKNPYKSRIDYIMLSPALAKCAVKGTAAVAGADAPTGSDHAPVVVELEIPTKDAEARKGWKWDVGNADRNETPGSAKAHLIPGATGKEQDAEPAEKK